MPQITGLDSPALVSLLTAVLHPMTMHHHALTQRGVAATVLSNGDLSVVTMMC